MKKTLLTFAIGSCFLFSCNNSTDPAATEATIVTDSTLQQNNEPAVSATGQQMPSTIDSGMTSAAIAAPSSSPPGQVTATAPGMNPPHGEPNHRCDIAVGAPLNSAPTKTIAPDAGAPVTPSMSPSPTLIPSSAPGTPEMTATPTTTAPGMNPPHGQPGHDCAIAVGAPLKK